MRSRQPTRLLAAITIGCSLTLLAVACAGNEGPSQSTDPSGVTAAASTVAATAGLPAPSTEQSTTAVAVTEAATSAPAGVGSTSTLAGIKAAQWADNVEVTVGDGTFTYVSNGLPNHELPDQFLVPKDGNMPPFTGDDIAAEFEIANTDELIVESPLDVEIPLNPVYSEEVTLTSLSTIGVMISGAPLFNDYEDQGREFVALDDNLSLDGVYFIDPCNGHPLASGSSYHYHGVPHCITDAVDVAGEHSTIIGFLRDGFPIYGPQDAGGVAMTNDTLDECSGHVGPTPEFPAGIYHYHLTDDAAPYSIDCYHGVIDAGTSAGGPAGGPPGGGGPPGDGAPPDLTEAAAALGVTVEELQAALGQPPFDLEAAAETLGVTTAELEAALPPPPGGPPGG